MPVAPVRAHMKSRLFVLVALVVGSLAAACNDPFAPKASLSVNFDTLQIFALTGTAPALPTAFDVAPRRLVKATGAFDYDIVFDIDKSGNVLLYPVRVIGGTYAASRTVGIQKLKVPF